MYISNQRIEDKKLTRLRPSIAEGILKSDRQIKAKSIFTNNNNNNINKPNNRPSNSKTPIIKGPNPTKQLPLSFSQLTGAALALASTSSMDHHHHDHSTMGHSSMETEAMRRCSMNMIFNSNPIGTCIVFRQFYISGTTALIGYLLLLFLLAIGYEYLRLATHRFDAVTKLKLGLRPLSNKKSSPSRASDRLSPSSSNENLIDSSKHKGWGVICVPRHIQITRSLFYVSNVALSFFLMLVVMTYNAQIIAAVLAGAFVGHFIFHRELSLDENDKGMACH